ncbi:MAG TPA: AURKAIP1/COX24 domain-containing protein [Verrucomicrobiae bacterium]|nr:AURKAIP1/COX24 domain-containing protein [Verrucomicrobiae bacterium]
MGSIKKRRKAKINKHKRRKKLRANRHKKRTWQR